ncbi:hypothetical protein HU200_043211 [Digitaria exilis]|uniref:P-type ATPase A domain-containing protein n=1 Tax=Digitaria exilis TaxID=1010633 RepID=A0A835EEG2_9POAL|nr:hypothetical protein HU200_043211 [Digitaria exilis]
MAGDQGEPQDLTKCWFDMQATAGMSIANEHVTTKAVLAETGQVVAAQDVKVNTVIAVKAGEIIPIDGVVVDGRSEVDESTLTGESFPVAKQPESQVWAGTLNIDGYIAVRTTAMADNSAVAKMARLVEEAPKQVSSIESRSSHPMASVLVDYAQSKSVEPKSDNVTEFQIYPGEGIYGEIDGERVYIGNKRILSRASCETVPDMKDMKGVTVGYVACKMELIGVFTLSDSCRTGSAEAIKELRSMGIKSVMLTGDSAAAAAYAQGQFAPVFCQLGNILDEVHSELLPEDKVRIVDELKEKHGPTLMIGDGMNDAPALAKADVGVSMGVSGSAVAMETSHITLMSNDIRRIPMAVQLARRTHRTIIVNIIFSVITKLAIVGLAIAGHPLIWAAVLADVGTCLLVIMYSMLLLRSKGGQKAKKCCASSQHGSHAKKHCVSRHCSDGPCKSTGSCKELSASKHGCHDHAHGHTHCKKPSNQQATEKHACHDHGHSHCKEPSNQVVTEKHACHDYSHSHCKQPSSQVVTEKHACHDHGHTHNHQKEPGNQVLVENHGCHDHEHGHCKEAKTSQSSDSKDACHGHQHNHCEEHNHSHSAGEHDCHVHEHSHCEEHSHPHSAVDQACHDHEHEHRCHAEQQPVHTVDSHHCHDHEHEHVHGEIEESEKDCHAELQHHHSHCCHEPHEQEKKIAAEPVQEISISIGSLPYENHEKDDQCSHHSEEHKVEDGTNHLKAKGCIPPPADHLSRNCCSVTSNKGCGSKGKDICPSWQAVCTREASRCCRSYVKCPRTSSCCSHTMLKLPEIVVE